MDRVAYPKKLTIALTDRCNLKCFICSRDEAEGGWNTKGEHLNLNHLSRIEKAIRHAEAISLSGFGESFLYPRLHEVLDYIYALNPRDNLIMFISNGTALSYTHGKKLGSRLRELVVSLNAANPEAYHRDMHPTVNRLDYRGKDDPRVRLEKTDARGVTHFEKTCRKIREFLRALEPSDRVKVRLHYVVHRDNMSEMSDFVWLAHDIGVSTVGFYHYMVTQESRIDYSVFFHQEAYNAALDGAREFGRRLGVHVDGARFGGGSPLEFNKELSCTSPFDEAIVYPNGAVSPCCHAGADQLGNAFTAGFDAVWFGRKYRMLREERHLDGCQTCNLYRSINDAEVHFHPVVKTTPRYRAIFPKANEAAASNPLKVLVVGTGADGSRTLWSLIKSCYVANQSEGSVNDVYDSYAVAEAAMAYTLTHDPDRPAKVLNAWRSEVVLGNAFAFFTPVLRDLFGANLKIIHLKRSRETAVPALVKRAELYPQNWGGYVPQAMEHDIVRPTARHFKEMSAATWGRLSLAEKIAWYFDKNQTLIEAARKEFPLWLDVRTEDLSNPETISRIATFINPEWTQRPSPVHMNAGQIFDLGAITDAHTRIRLARALRDFDLSQALESDTYAIGYFIERMRETPMGSARDDVETAKRLLVVKRKIDRWIATARRGQFGSLPANQRATSRRIRHPMLSPEKQIKLERALSGFDIHRMAADDTYAATFFLERMVAPHSGNPALYPELAIALQPMSTLLYNIISDHSADVLASETHLDAQAPDSATAA